MIRWPELVSQVRERVRLEDFRREECAVAFRAISTVADRGEPAIYTSVCRELGALGAKNGLTADIADWATDAVSPLYVGWHCLNVIRASQRRRLKDAASAVANRAIDPSLDSDAALKAAHDVISAVPRLHQSTPELLDPESFAMLAVELNAARESGQESDALSTGLYDLDKQLAGGVWPGQLVIVGGRTGMGKSSLLRDMARAISKLGPVLFASNELTREQLVDRDLAVNSGVSVHAIREGKWSPEDRERIRMAESILAFTPIHTYADGTMTSARLRNLALEFHARENLKAVVVDYLQRMPDPGKDSLARVGYTVRALKSLAMELNVPVIAGAQLNRGTEAQEKARPTLTNLRESGEIEQEADVALLLYRKGYYDQKEGKNAPAIEEADIILAKNRQGPSGITIPVLWCGPLSTFRNLAR